MSRQTTIPADGEPSQLIPTLTVKVIPPVLTVLLDSPNPELQAHHIKLSQALDLPLEELDRMVDEYCRLGGGALHDSPCNSTALAFADTSRPHDISPTPTDVSNIDHLLVEIHDGDHAIAAFIQDRLDLILDQCHRHLDRLSNRSLSNQDLGKARQLVADIRQLGSVVQWVQQTASEWPVSKKSGSKLPSTNQSEHGTNSPNGSDDQIYDADDEASPQVSIEVGQVNNADIAMNRKYHHSPPKSLYHTQNPARTILHAAGKPTPSSPVCASLNKELALLLPDTLGAVPKPFRRMVDDLRSSGALRYPDTVEESLAVSGQVDGHAQQRIGGKGEATRLAVYQDAMVRMMSGWWLEQEVEGFEKHMETD